jgi:adenosylcobinamide-GDP ribazoletransferase
MFWAGGNYYLVFRSIQSIISFLTIIPVHKKSLNSSNSNLNDIYYIAKNMYLFPVVGVIIGIIVGGLAYGISFYIQPLLTGLLITSALIIITGANHIDALADFADGLMTKGGKEFKVRAMRDPAVGSAGTVSIVIYVAGMIIALSSFQTGTKLLTGIIVSEVVAKYIMVIHAYRGLSAWEGFSSPFTAAMKDKRKVLASTAITLPIIWFLSNSYACLVLLGLSLAIAVIIQYISNKSFGGISGDVIGASNEITRISCLLIFSSMS